MERSRSRTLTWSAIILRNGSQRDNVIELASKILIKYGGLSGLMSASFHELCNEYGLGMAKAAQLKAALEMGKRLSMEQPDKKYQIRSVDDAANLVRMELMYLDHEEFHLARSRSIRHSDNQGTCQSPGHCARGDGTSWLVSAHQKQSVCCFPPLAVG